MTGDRSDFIVEYLRDSDARCPICAYRLKGCPSDRCPECGAALALRVESPGRRSAWRIAGILGTAWSSLLLLALTIMLMDEVVHVLADPAMANKVRGGIVSSAQLPNWPAIAMLVALNVAVLALMTWLVVSGSRLSRVSGPLRIGIGLLAALSPLIVIGIIAIGSRWLMY